MRAIGIQANERRPIVVPSATNGLERLCLSAVNCAACTRPRRESRVISMRFEKLERLAVSLEKVTVTCRSQRISAAGTVTARSTHAVHDAQAVGPVCHSRGFE